MAFAFAFISFSSSHNSEVFPPGTEDDGVKSIAARIRVKGIPAAHLVTMAGLGLAAGATFFFGWNGG